MRIPLYDVAGENEPVTAELRAAFERVLASGRFAAGPEVRAFENEMAAFLGLPHAIACHSGTDALVLALRGLGIGPGDEVITTAFTFFATAEAIILAGAQPVFADIEPDTLCLSVESCKATLTPRAKALLLVHVFGLCTDVDVFAAFCREHNLALVEDAAQAIGATWRGRNLGSIGAAGTFSFYPTKNLSALGSGGAVATCDPKLDQAIRSLQDHGIDTNDRHVRIGCNSRMDELQAAFLRVKLARLEVENARRRALAARYDAELPAKVRRVRGAEGCVSNFHQYAIRTPRRDDLRRYLTDRGIGTGDYYSTPVHLEPALAGVRISVPLTETEQACREVLTLPVRPSLTDDNQAQVIGAVRDFFGLTG